MRSKAPLILKSASVEPPEERIRFSFQAGNHELYLQRHTLESRDPGEGFVNQTQSWESGRAAIKTAVNRKEGRLLRFSDEPEAFNEAAVGRQYYNVIPATP